MQEKIQIGKVLKAQGIKGEIKIGCSLDNATMMNKVDTLFVGAKSYAVSKIRADGTFCYVLLKGITDRNMAEELRNLPVFAYKNQLSIPKDRYFIDDLIGCDIIDEQQSKLGTVVDLLQYGAADVFVCEAQVGFSFPFLKDVVVKVDVDSKQIFIANKRFEEVVVYDD